MILAVSLYTLNLIDMVMTLLIVERSGDEANPVMDALFSYGVLAFVFYKVVVVGALATFFTIRPLPRWASVSLVMLAILYFLVVVLHVTQVI